MNSGRGFKGQPLQLMWRPLLHMIEPDGLMFPCGFQSTFERQWIDTHPNGHIAMAVLISCPWDFFSSPSLSRNWLEKGNNETKREGINSRHKSNGNGATPRFTSHCNNLLVFIVGLPLDYEKTSLDLKFYLELCHLIWWWVGGGGDRMSKELTLKQSCSINFWLIKKISRGMGPREFN